MSTPVTAARPTIVDRVVPRGVWTEISLVLGGAVVVAIAAQLSMNIGPVPITGQTLAVMLVGCALGARRGAMALLTYMIGGLAGAPVFADFTGGPLTVLKPSFGFVIGFVVAAAAIGWLAEHEWDRTVLKSIVGFFVASTIPFAFGLPYLAVVLHSLGAPSDLGSVLSVGLVPFVLPGIIKWGIAAALMPLAWRFARRDAR